ncbi:hypothetical protein [Bacillus sp. FJAT-22090]|uniref:hypothetical protein n=1 Tax=Bacillus sp. FJAT-22090 TaxID=1581038 RepID=UPI0011A4CA54|nr:hypothetical protein [Bacillus sp. FJAT-22090]
MSIINEIFLHKLTGAFDGNETFSLTEQLNDNEKWSEIVKRVEMVQHSLREAISKMTNEDFELSDLEEKLYNIILHDAYHTGQIIQIRKMQGSWPSHR